MHAFGWRPAGDREGTRTDPLRRRRRIGTALAGIWLTVSAVGVAPGQELPLRPEPSPASSETEPTSPEAIEARQRAVLAELSATGRALAEARDEPLRAHLEEIQGALGRIEALVRKQKELATSTPASRPVPSGGPDASAPSVFALNELYEARFEASQHRERTAEQLAESRDALATAREKLEEAEARRRGARTALEAEQDPPSRVRAERTLELRRLESRTAQERVHLRALETRLAQRAQAQVEPESDLEERIREMREAIARSPGGTPSDPPDLAQREGELRRERRSLERRISTVELRLESAQQRFSRHADPPAELLEEVEALSARRDAIRQEIALIDAKLERLGTQGTVWRRWGSVLRGAGTREDFDSWKDEVAARIRTLETLALDRQGQRADLAGRLEGLKVRLSRVPEGARVRAVLEEQRNTLARLLDAERVEEAELVRDLRLSTRLLADLRDRTGEIDPLAYVARGIQAVRDTWTYEITAVDDAPITVGSLVVALILAGFGLWASRRGSTLVGRVAAERFRLDPGAVHALQTLSFYVLLVSFTLFALRAVHFPLTAFTVVGGALAIGIGFGSQNVMNNFISGLILMLERPVRARDVIEVDGNHGTIEKIGARSTQIRSTDGRHIVVPNSFFLESNVVNWTLSDDLIRTSVEVGVIYGSPTRLVEQLIRRVVDEEERVIKAPEPIILFEQFGDNSLGFEVHFWVRARSPMEVRTVQSRVRFRIDDLFREHHLTIAFPQRDVHVDSVAPIEVRVVNGGSESARG